MKRERIVFSNDDETLALLGKNDENLRLIQAEFSCNLISRGNEILFSGEKEEVEKAFLFLSELLRALRSGHLIAAPEVRYSLKLFEEERSFSKIFEEAICVSERGRLVKPRTLGQKRYVEAIKKYDIVAAIGPAGTGKTYLSVASGLSLLLTKRVARIILTRPAIEAGEKLGFLPGDLQDKVNPYLRPLYDALYDMMGLERIHKLLADGTIEIAPLAYMRGRTLNDSFIILDEAQNTTCEQMKMFLTRLGFDSKAVITGDITQTDLPTHTISGLAHIQEVLKGINGIKFCYFDESDVVRHPLVSEIILAYEKHKKGIVHTNNSSLITKTEVK
ncbi:PhoH family protein [bacterium]|nr:PhoH family protein [bacterium]MBU1598718.1 PhoH family protein [bacterium]MBU2462339.1 PhoH family protein [bacterium]